MSKKRTFSLLFVALMLTFVVGMSLALGSSPSLAAFNATEATSPQALVGSGFTYQGRLTGGDGQPVNDACDLDFALWDAETGGSMAGHQIVTGVAVDDGYLAVLLNGGGEFGEVPFDGQARWLKIAVKCSGDADWHILPGRQLLSATPYALSLRPGARIVGEQAGSPTLHVQNSSSTNSSTAIHGYASATSGYAYGMYGRSDSPEGRGVYGWASATSGYTYGVRGQSDSTEGRGVYGYATATGGTTYGVYGRSASTEGSGVYGYAPATSGIAIGVYGQSDSTVGRGVNGIASAFSGLNVGVYGRSNSPSGYGGYFDGDVRVLGNLSATGAKPFEIDHPLDPANCYLYHFAQEAPQVQNIYNDVITLDANGEAVVTLPDYFSTLNTGPFRYQLTPIGAPMPNLYITQEIQGNIFKIAGGVPGAKVSWEVTAVRNDPYLRDHPVQAEADKPAEERGTYLYPEGYGQPQEMGLDYQRNADLRQP